MAAGQHEVILGARLAAGDAALERLDGGGVVALLVVGVPQQQPQRRVGRPLAQAQAEPDQRLACRYALVGESVRAKLSVSATLPSPRMVAAAIPSTNR